MAGIRLTVPCLYFKMALRQGFPPRWLAPSSCMVYWAVAELYLRAQFLGQPITKEEAMCVVFCHVEWECTDRPLQEETMFYLDYAIS